MDDILDLVQGCAKESKGRRSKELEAFTVKAVDQEARQITAVASTEAIDRDGEIIKLAAFKKALPGYMRNPVILAGHLHKTDSGKSPVVGKCVAAEVTKTEFVIRVEFADTELGLEYWKLYSQKYQKAFSVGFFIKKSVRELIDGKHVNVIYEVELFEISCIPVGSNHEALSKAKQRKRDFIADKRGSAVSQGVGIKAFDELTEKELAGLSDDELDILLENDADFQGKAAEYAEALWSGVDDELKAVAVHSETDISSLVNGSNSMGDCADLVRRRSPALCDGSRAVSTRAVVAKL